MAWDVETEKPVVVYQVLHGEPGHWVRSLADFTVWVSRGRYEGPRFVRVNGGDSTIDDLAGAVGGHT